MDNNKSLRKKYLILSCFTLILSVIYLLRIPVEIFYNKDKFIFEVLSIILFVLVIPYCTYRILNFFFSTKISACGMFLLFFISLISWPFLLKQNEIKCLEEDGKWVYGKVVDTKFESYDKRGDKGWYIKIEFLVADKLHTTDWEKVGIKKTYQIKDSIKLIYSEKYPSLYRIENVWNTYKKR